MKVSFITIAAVLALSACSMNEQTAATSAPISAPAPAVTESAVAAAGPQEAQLVESDATGASDPAMMSDGEPKQTGLNNTELGEAGPDSESPSSTLDAASISDGDTMAMTDMNDAAASACLSEGGSLMEWADASGDMVPACRRSDGVEYRLSDAAYFQ